MSVSESAVASVARRGGIPPKWLLLKLAGGTKGVAGRHLKVAIFWLELATPPKIAILGLFVAFLCQF